MDDALAEVPRVGSSGRNESESKMALPPPALAQNQHGDDQPGYIPNPEDEQVDPKFQRTMVKLMEFQRLLSFIQQATKKRSKVEKIQMKMKMRKIPCDNILVVILEVEVAIDYLTYYVWG